VKWSAFIKSALLLFIVFLGLLRFNPLYLVENFNLTGLSNLKAFQNGVGVISFSFLGIETGGYLITIAKNPREDLPKATVIGTALAAVFYVLILLALLGSLPAQILRSAIGSVPAILLSQFIHNVYAKSFIRILVIASCYGSLNSNIFCGNEGAKDLRNDLSNTTTGTQSSPHAPLWMNIGTMLLTLIALLLGFPHGIFMEISMLCCMITFALMFFAYLRLVWTDNLQVFFRHWNNIGIALVSFTATLYYIAIICGNIVKYFV
jgi:APA family basic amino acid/polyamine antiporter